MAHLYVLIAGALARHRERGNHLLLLEEQAALGGWKRTKEGFSVTDDTVKSWVVVVDFRNVNYFLVKAKWQRREVTRVVSPGRGCAVQTTPGTMLAWGREAFGLPPFFPYPLQLCQRSSSLPCSKPASPVNSPCSPQFCCSTSVPPQGVAGPAGPVWTPRPSGQTVPPSPAVWDAPCFANVLTTDNEQDELSGCPAMSRNPCCISYGGQSCQRSMVSSLEPNVLFGKRPREQHADFLLFTSLKFIIRQSFQCQYLVTSVCPDSSFLKTRQGLQGLCFNFS